MIQHNDQNGYYFILLFSLYFIITWIKIKKRLENKIRKQIKYNKKVRYIFSIELKEKNLIVKH